MEPNQEQGADQQGADQNRQQGADQDYVDRLIEVVARSHDPAVTEAKALAYRLRRLAHRLETDIKRELTRRAWNCGNWNCWAV
ncbi:hypothetical protein GXW82_16600 [Streptacidiphilus sp. 4-A2]|nr:hypothetical protein [Streptacidiphilus sp. 4-A2]